VEWRGGGCDRAVVGAWGGRRGFGSGEGNVFVFGFGWRGWRRRGRGGDGMMHAVEEWRGC
jgi:hypothetical protein